MFSKIIRFILQKFKIILLFFNQRIIIGKNCRIDFITRINVVGKLYIGDNVSLRSYKKGYQAAMPYPTTILVDIKEATVTIGKNSRINGAYIHAQNSVTIGTNCLIASGVQILDSNGHEVISPNRTNGRDCPNPITIGNNVWIGINAIILKGTHIGDNCVIGANVVVKGNIKDNSIVTTAKPFIETISLS
jgi:acetyltransferase-like isoleucine patch superfamily enzyme